MSHIILLRCYYFTDILILLNSYIIWCSYVWLRGTNNSACPNILPSKNYIAPLAALWWSIIAWPQEMQTKVDCSKLLPRPLLSDQPFDDNHMKIRTMIATSHNTQTYLGFWTDTWNRSPIRMPEFSSLRKRSNGVCDEGVYLHKGAWCRMIHDDKWYLNNNRLLIDIRFLALATTDQYKLIFMALRTQSISTSSQTSALLCWGRLKSGSSISTLKRWLQLLTALS